MRAIRYFIKVVEMHSFSKAALECHITQSALSQQIMRLETELGFRLLERKGRSFSLTRAGALYYAHVREMVSTYDRACKEAALMASACRPVLRVGYLSGADGGLLDQALLLFHERYPQIRLITVPGSHEQIYQGLLHQRLDCALNDQRRAFSSNCGNHILAPGWQTMEFSSSSSLAQKEVLGPEDLADETILVVSDLKGAEDEILYLREILGLEGNVKVVSSLEEARRLALAGAGVLPMLEYELMKEPSDGLVRRPYWRSGSLMERNWCLFYPMEKQPEGLAEFIWIMDQVMHLQGDASPLEKTEQKEA